MSPSEPFVIPGIRHTRLAPSVLLNDTKLWKAARSCWHRLIIAGLLKEYDSKKDFAKVTTHFG